MFIFHLVYFFSCKNFCKDYKKKYILQNTFCFFQKKLMEPPFSECLALLKNRVTLQLLIYFNIGFRVILSESTQVTTNTHLLPNDGGKCSKSSKFSALSRNEQYSLKDSYKKRYVTILKCGVIFQKLSCRKKFIFRFIASSKQSVKKLNIFAFRASEKIHGVSSF